MTRLALLALALSACTDSPDAHQRAAAGDAVGTAVASASIYLALAQLGTVPLVTGTRDSFTIAGTTQSPWSGTAQLTGSGTMTGTTLEMEMTAELAAWRDDFWRLTLDGSVDVIETATFAAATDPFPTSLVQQITGELDISGQIEGTYSFELTICRRGDGRLGYNRYGLRGTVDGEEASDQTPGTDGSCAPTN